MFQHTAARRRLADWLPYFVPAAGFNTQPPEGGWFSNIILTFLTVAVSTHSRPKAAGISTVIIYSSAAKNVSTHSRPKAAGLAYFMSAMMVFSFNTQPPEGGWFLMFCLVFTIKCFNTQPPEGGWTGDYITANKFIVSTHSRPKAAGQTAKRR